MTATSRKERYTTRAIDIIVHGATGFTGKRVLAHLVKHHPELNVAICGRSQEKLTAVANVVGWDESKCKSSIYVVSDIVNDSDKLVAAFSNAKVVIACAGPYRQCGIPILKAAVEARADYLDLCGEPQFFDDALLSFDRQAREAGVLACHAAAFDCVPAELGAALAERELLKNCTSCAGVEVIHTMQNISRANATTFHAAVDGFHAAASGELAKSRKKVSESYPEFKETMPPSRPNQWEKGLVAAPGILPGYNESLGLRTMKFVGADSASIRSSWRYLRSRKPDHPRKGTAIPEPRLSVLIGMDAKDITSVLKVMGFGATFSLLARYKWGCDMLHANPEGFSGGVFTAGGPTQEELEKGRFCTYVTAFGPTSSDPRARIKVSGPEPGYVATPILIISLALTILDAGKADRNDLSFESGVTLPGALFGDSEKVYEYMRNEGVNFDVVDEFDDSQSPVVCK